MTSIFEYNKEEEDKKLYQAGVEQGIDLGIERGIEQNRKEIASALAGQNMPDDKIAEIIGVDVGTIEKWRHEAGGR